MKLNDPAEYINGVGPKYSKCLKKLGISTVRDLVYHIPVSYRDYSELLSTDDIKSEETGLLCVGVMQAPVTYRIRKNLSKTTFTVSESENLIYITVFNQSYFRNYIKEGSVIYVYGKIQKVKGYFTMTSPEIYMSRPDSFRPVYSLTAGLSQNMIKKITMNALDSCRIEDPYSDAFRSRFGCMGLRDALYTLHAPDNLDGIVDARSRLVLDDFLMFRAAVAMSEKNSLQQNTKRINDEGLLEKFSAKLPFELTAAQKRVMNEMAGDMKSGFFMNRLVQGDVGSGKTVVAFYAMYLASHSGYQSALMAPTELLARQHFKNAVKFFDENEIAFLSGSMSVREKRMMYSDIESGRRKYIIGTHALLYDKFTYNSLGLVITDEQHRFGVRQRSALAHGENVHYAVMSATPIPRSLAVTMFGRANVSCVDELPPGRKKINTYVMSYKKFGEMLEFVSQHAAQGEQAYFVCPSIKDNPESELENVEKNFGRLSSFFRDFKVSCLHGKMETAEKDETMKAFADGSVNILVSTTVVEVGVDIPSATIMCILDSDRFGLAQLHQLRGRVGRSDRESYCFLVTSNAHAIERLKVLSSSNDGFYIAEKDLEIRGGGDMFGTRQHGILSFGLANVYDDAGLYEKSGEIFDEISENAEWKREFEYISLAAEENYGAGSGGMTIDRFI